MIMNTTEMLDKFKELYLYMYTSKKEKYMKTFGAVMQEMFEYISNTRQEVAQNYLDKLCSIKWYNYLTKEEAENIISKMVPKSNWTYDSLIKQLDSLGIVKEEEPYYNSYALFVTMNMIYSDSSNTIAKILDKNINEISNEEFVKITHSFAIDKLKDIDHNFNIRDYFKI